MADNELGAKNIVMDAHRLRAIIGSQASPSTPTDHGTLTGLGDDDHSQYVHISSARSISAQHQFARPSASPPFTLNANAQGQTVIGLSADQLQTFTPSFDPQATAKILRTDPSGYVILERLGIEASPTDARLLIDNDEAATVPFAIEAAAAQTANLLEIRNSAGTPLTYIQNDGDIIVSGNSGLASSGAGTLYLTSTDDIFLTTGIGDDVIILGGRSLTWSTQGNITTNLGVLTIDPSDDLDLSPTGNINVAAHLLPDATDTYDIGSSTLLWRKGWLSELDTILFVENTITLLGGWFYVTPDAGTIPSDVTDVATQIDFGKAMTTNDFVVFRISLQVEYMQVGTLVSGTTYNVTRNLDGTGANNWPAGSAFAVLGNSGDGRIELNAYDSPRIQILKQGATYNAQTEMIRIGDLEGNWGYGAGSLTWGIAIGEYAASKGNLTYDPTNGLRLRTHGTTVIHLDNSGNADFTGVIGIGSSGGIYQGSGSFGTPTTGLKIWNDGGTGRIAGYNAGTLQATFETTGKLTAGAGDVILDADGLSIRQAASATWDSTSGIQFGTASDPDILRIWSYESGGINEYAYIQYNVSDAMQNEFDFNPTRCYMRGPYEFTGQLRASGTPRFMNLGIGSLSTAVDDYWIWMYDIATGPGGAGAGIIIGDTSNADMTTGITINQMYNTNQILAFKQKNVAHGITSLLETDTFAYLNIQNPGTGTEGGLQINGIAEDDVGVRINGWYVNDDTDKLTTARAAVEVNAFKKSGTGLGSPGSNANLMNIRSNNATQFIFDADGDSHQNVGTSWTNFDEHDDVALLDAVAALIPQDPIKTAFVDFLYYNQQDLQRLKIANFQNQHPYNVMVNTTKLQQLLVGAVRQLAGRLKALEAGGHMN